MNSYAMKYYFDLPKEIKMVMYLYTRFNFVYVNFVYGLECWVSEWGFWTVFVMNKGRFTTNHDIFAFDGISRDLIE